MKLTKQEIRVRELKRIAEANGGVLKPEKVVAAAKDVKNPLHECFTWDNTEAAKAHRLWEARQLISVSVEYLESTGQDTRVFVSLKSDRGDGGYRKTVSVMSVPEQRAELLQDALEDLELFRTRYHHLRELAGIFQEEQRIRERLSKRVKATEKVKSLVRVPVFVSSEVRRASSRSTA